MEPIYSSDLDTDEYAVKFFPRLRFTFDFSLFTVTQYAEFYGFWLKTRISFKAHYS